MNTETAILKATNDQQALSAKRESIVLRLSALQAEIDKLVSISEYASLRLAENGDAAKNLSGEKLDPCDVIPLVAKASIDDLLKWESQSDSLEDDFRTLLVRPT